MNVETLPFQEVLKRAPDIFEAVVVAGQRSGQINARRASERVEYEIDDIEEDYPLMDEINEDYVELEMKPTNRPNEYAATVPGAFIVPEWDFMYLFEVMDEKSSGKTYPDMEKETPYVVVELER